MTTVNMLHNITKQLYEHLNTPMPKEEREPYIEKVETLLAERATLMLTFKAKPTAEEQLLANEIIEWNKIINQRLSSYVTTIKIDLNKLKQQKQTGMRYENPYEAPTDGIFIDKKN